MSQLQAFVDGLPRGLDSYPDHLQKASLVRKWMEASPKHVGDRMPPALSALEKSPPPASAWIPETHATAVYLAYFDHVFQTEEAFLTQTLRFNRKLLSGPIYRVVMVVVSPEYLVKKAAGRWELFHRGVKMTAHIPQKGRAQIQLIAPVGLIPRVIGRMYGTAFEAAIECAGGREVRFAVEEPAPGKLNYEVEWT